MNLQQITPTHEFICSTTREQDAYIKRSNTELFALLQTTTSNEEAHGIMDNRGIDVNEFNAAGYTILANALRLIEPHWLYDEWFPNATDDERLLLVERIASHPKTIPNVGHFCCLTIAICSDVDPPIIFKLIEILCRYGQSRFKRAILTRENTKLVMHREDGLKYLYTVFPLDSMVAMVSVLKYRRLAKPECAIRRLPLALLKRIYASMRKDRPLQTST